MWQFASTLKNKVSVSLVGGGFSNPLILGRAMSASDIIQYRAVPVGQYKLEIRAAAADMGVSNASPEVLPPVSVAVGAQTFQTILFQDVGSTPKIFLANDSIAGTGVPKGGKRLRIFNFAPNQDASLKTSPSNEVISAHVPPGMSEHVFPSNPGMSMLVMSNKLKNGFSAEQSIEIDFRSVDSISILISFDKYGRLALAAMEDAKN
ncbi:MAG TPA: hypothetical protein VGM62_03825 [Chthoniobacterales bacterium]